MTTLKQETEVEFADVRTARNEVVEARPQRPPVAAGLDSVIERLISDPTIDLERVKTALALRKDIEQENARKSYNVAMARCKSLIPVVIKNAENSDNKAKYATLDAIGEQVDHILGENGITTSFYPVPSTKEKYIRVECVVAHVDGYERRFETEVPYDMTGAKGGVNKTEIHGWRSAATYARRTLYEMIFDIKSKKLTLDDDGNAAGGRGSVELISAEQADMIRELVKKTGTNIDTMLAVYKVESIPDIRASDFGRLHKQLEAKLARKIEDMAK